MRIPLLAFYAGPDQVMVAASALATALGFGLMLWNRLVSIFGKLLNRLGRTAETSVPPE
jgi:hypothetical protein